jgi:hypothetical protein
MCRRPGVDFVKSFRTKIYGQRTIFFQAANCHLKSL